MFKTAQCNNCPILSSTERRRQHCHPSTLKPSVHRHQMYWSCTPVPDHTNDIQIDLWPARSWHLSWHRHVPVCYWMEKKMILHIRCQNPNTKLVTVELDTFDTGIHLILLYRLIHNIVSLVTAYKLFQLAPELVHFVLQG